MFEARKIGYEKANKKFDLNIDCKINPVIEVEDFNTEEVIEYEQDNN